MTGTVALCCSAIVPPHHCRLYGRDPRNHRNHRSAKFSILFSTASAIKRHSPRTPVCHVNPPSSAFASLRSRVPNPSVNHPTYTGANNPRASRTLPWLRQRRARLMAARSSQDFACCFRATMSARSKYPCAFAVCGAGDLTAISPATRLTFGFEPLFLICLYRVHRVGDIAPSVVEFPKRRMRAPKNSQI